MNDSETGSFTGPIEETEWPERLRAHVVEPGPRPRVHGYDVQGDLARHYGFAEVALLALTGELPSEEAARAFDVALVFAAPISVAEAPAHAGVLAKLCGATAQGVIGTGAVALAEQAGFMLEEHGEILEWLAARRADPTLEAPRSALSTDEEERAAVEGLAAALEGSGVGFLRDREDLGLVPAILLILDLCGLDTPEKLATAILVSRLPCVVAEACHVRAGLFQLYPMDLPPFRYEEDR